MQLKPRGKGWKKLKKKLDRRGLYNAAKSIMVYRLIVYNATKRQISFIVGAENEKINLALRIVRLRYQTEEPAGEL